MDFADLSTTHLIDHIETAAKALREGMLVAFPTETVYGLGADATNPSAIHKLFEAKGRPSDNPLIVHLSDFDQLKLASNRITADAQKLLEAFSPGPLTVVVPKNPGIFERVTAGLNTVGIRIPNHLVARELLRICNLPIAAPSANLSGRPSCTTWQSVLEDLDGRIDFVLRGSSASEIGIESTVVDCTGEVPILLRPGAITLEQLRQVVPAVVVAGNEEKGNGMNSVLRRSPGLRHAHYQPNAKVQLIQSVSELKDITDDRLRTSALAGFDASLSKAQLGKSEFLLLREYQSIEDYQAGFYEFLREADRVGATTIYLEAAPNNDRGAALLDRQKRAAGEKNEG